MSYSSRRQRVRELLRSNKLSSLLVSYATNRFYLSGFELHDVQLNETAGFLLITESGRDWLCTDARYLDAARRLWPENDILIYKGDASLQIADLLKEQGGKSVGIEAECLSYRFVKSLGEHCSCELTAADHIVKEVRIIKDAIEIAALEESFALNHAMLSWVKDELVEGISEKELAWKIERYFREHGASELAFPSIAAFGTNAALPHAIPSQKLLRPETCVLLDVGCRVENYCSDQTRTFWFGEKEPDYFRETRDLVAEAQTRAIEALRPGLLGKEAHAIALDVFTKAGVDKYFTHSLGHGVGLDTHESPSLNARSEIHLQPGMIVTVEPGLYYPAWGGVRLEFTVLIEENRARIL